MVDYTKASGAVVDAQGRPQFADRNDALGVQGTYLDAKDRNQDRNTLVSAVLASGQVPDGANDDQLTIAIQAEGIPLWSQSVATAIKGYPLGAVVRDASPKYWLSAVPNNMTVPGADGATWMNFFAGVMTQQQADLRYLMLSGGNVTGPMDWGSKTSASTLTHRYWSAGPPAEGDATPDATLTIAGGTPGTANKGTLALSTGVFDLSASGQVLVPSIVSFDGKDALNALTADGRYIRSVPATGGTNVRIVDVQEDAAGNLIATKSDGTTASYAPGSYGTFTGGYWIQTGNIRQIWWSQTVHAGDTVPFPLAFAAAPKVYAQQSLYLDQAPYWEMGFVCINAALVTAQNFVLNTTVLYSNAGGNFGPPANGVIMNFYAAGVVS